MAIDPVRDEPTRPMRNDLPPRDYIEPRSDEIIERDDRSTGWMPLLILAALVIGALYYFYGDRLSSNTPAVRADTGGAVTKSEPSPN
jgi:hypothetical protein